MAKEELPKSIQESNEEHMKKMLQKIGVESDAVSEVEVNEAIHQVAEDMGQDFTEEPNEEDQDIIDAEANEGWKYLGMLSNPRVKESTLRENNIKLVVNNGRGLLFKWDEELFKKAQGL